MTTTTRLALVASLLLAAAPARGEEGFAQRTFEPSPAGDRFFVAPDATVAGSMRPAAVLLLDWSENLLVLRQGGQVVPNGQLIERQLALLAGGSLSLGERVLVDLSLPLALSRQGSQPFAGSPPVSGSGVGDLRVGARARLLGGERLAVAAAVRLWLPTGQQADYDSDGQVRVEPQLVASGRLGQLVYAGDAGVLLRKDRQLVLAEVGPAMTFSAGAGWLLLGDRLQVGPELYGRYQSRGTHTSSTELLLGARWRQGDFTLGAGVTSRLGHDAPGASPFRALLQLGWAPRCACAPAKVAPPPPAPPPPPPPPPPMPAPRPEPVVAVTAPPPPPPPVAAPVPVAPPPVVEVTKDRLELKETVYFDPGTANIQARSRPLLDAVAAVLAAHPEVARVVVEGHTDSQGAAAPNQRLSAQRADAVKAYLVARGVAAARLEARGLGSDRPVASNGTPEGREKNRRVEFLIP